MATARNEVYAFHAWLKTPGTDRLRKNAQAELRHLLAAGWHETGRTAPAADHLVIRLERPAVVTPVQQTPRRREEPGDGGGGGGRAGGGGGARAGGGARGGGGGRRQQ